MDIQTLNAIFTSDLNLDSITSVRQNWSADTNYNRMEIPRQQNALLLVTDYPAVFQFPGGRSLQANVGDIILLPKDSRYLLRFLVPNDLQTHPIVINFRLRDAEGNEITCRTGVLKICSDDGSLAPLFHASVEFYKRASTIRLKAKIFELLGELFPIIENDACCIAFINRHYTEKFSIPLLAQKCALSECAYRKRFKQLTGLSPVQYINKLKIEKACQLILTGDITMQEISDFLNFYNLPYFYKVFRENTGLTPLQYRQEQGVLGGN